MQMTILIFFLKRKKWYSRRKHFLRIHSLEQESENFLFAKEKRVWKIGWKDIVYQMADNYRTLGLTITIISHTVGWGKYCYNQIHLTSKQLLNFFPNI